MESACAAGVMIVWEGICEETVTAGLETCALGEEICGAGSASGTCVEGWEICKKAKQDVIVLVQFVYCMYTVKPFVSDHTKHIKLVAFSQVVAKWRFSDHFSKVQASTNMFEVTSPAGRAS